MTINNGRLQAFISVGLLCCAQWVRAFDVSEAAGQWRILNFSVPSQLTLQYNGQGVVTNIPEAANFESSSGSITVQSNGTFSGAVPNPVSGTISVGGQGEVIFHLNDTNSPPTMTFHLNRTADFMTTCENSGSGSQDLVVGLRSPTTLTTNDLAGRWNAYAISTPSRLVLGRDVSNRIVNIQGIGNFETYGGTLSINSNGTIAGDVGGAFTGLVASASSGVVNLIVMDEEGGDSVSLFINAGKDMMAFVESAYDQDDNYQQIVFFQKASVTNPVSRLASPWRIVTYSIPQLTPQFNGSGHLIGLNGRNNFEAARQSLVSGYDGFFTAQIGGVETGTFSPATNGVLSVNVQSEDGPETIGFNLSSGETLLGTGRFIGDGWELLLLTKSYPVPGPAQDFGLVMSPKPNALEFDWAAATNSVLQSSSNLVSWQTLSNTLGQHTYTTGVSNSASFFRVTKPTP